MDTGEKRNFLKMLDDEQFAEALVSKLLDNPAVADKLALSAIKSLHNGAVKVQICTVGDGVLPDRQSDGAVGSDVCACAIVDPVLKDENDPRLRKTIFDFKTHPGNKYKDNVFEYEDEETGKTRLGWILRPGERWLVDIGIAYYMPPDTYQWVAPRSGLSSQHGITVGNSPGTIDSDYRGVAGIVLINMSDKPYRLKHNDRVGQMLFGISVQPSIEVVNGLDDLPASKRGAGGFGSTGFRQYRVAD